MALENKLTHKHIILHCADFYRSKTTKEFIYIFSYVLQFLLFSSLLSEQQAWSGGRVRVRRGCNASQLYRLCRHRIISFEHER